MFPIFRSSLNTSSRRLLFGLNTYSRQTFTRNALRNPSPIRNGVTRNFHFSRNFFNTIKRQSETVANVAADSAKSQPKQKLSLKELTKKYGWSAVGVYFALSALDLPLCFLFVHSMGQERVGQLEKAVKGFFGFGKSEDGGIVEDAIESVEGAVTGEASKEETSTEDGYNWSLLITEFTIAYAIHKSVFIFVRVPTTAAITPWVVRKLQSYGFNIGGKAVQGASKFGTSPTKRQKWTSWFF